MNLSGFAVSELLSYYKATAKDLIVICDDFDLPAGYVRIRESGSGGTHNGMRNIIQVLGFQDFARIRIGFKPQEENRIPLINLVLSKIPKEKEELFNKAVLSAASGALDFIRGESISSLMAKYNGNKA